MKAIVLIQVDFDSMENHSPVSQKIIKTFVAENGLSPYGVMADWWRTQPPVQHYVGYDANVYPQFRTKVEY